FFFSSRRRHTRFSRDWSSDVCSSDLDRPKVIASTATIRRAADQGRHLFARAVRQFPPAGLDSRDSWFAVETPREEKASRRYVGRSEERRVGKEGRARRWQCQERRNGS